MTWNNVSKHDDIFFGSSPFVTLYTLAGILDSTWKHLYERARSSHVRDWFMNFDARFCPDFPRDMPTKPASAHVRFDVACRDI